MKMATNAPTSHEEALKVPGALPKLPILEAKKTYRLASVNEARKYFNNFHMILGGDHAAYYNTHLSEFLPTALAMPSGPVRELKRAIVPVWRIDQG